MGEKEKDTIPTSIRLPRDLKESLERLAAADDRTLNNYLLVVLKRWVKENTKK